MGYQPRLPSGVCHWLKEKKAVLQKKTFKCHLNADIDEVWKSTSFDRMQAAMRTFAVDDTSARSLEGRNAMGKNLEFQGYISKFSQKCYSKTAELSFLKVLIAYGIERSLVTSTTNFWVKSWVFFSASEWWVGRLTGWDGWMAGHDVEPQTIRFLERAFRWVGCVQFCWSKNWGQISEVQMCPSILRLQTCHSWTIRRQSCFLSFLPMFFFACHTVEKMFWPGG